MEIGIIIICLIIFFAIAEFFGRRKHIGRWWTFGLLASNLIFGLIALIVSPSVKNDPTAGSKSYKIWGWVCIVLGAGGLIQMNPFAIGLFALGAYLIQLSEGKVINNDPKDYFEPNISFNVKPPQRSVIINNHYYFLMIDGKQSDPFTFEELKNKRIKESDVVWRKGFDVWLKASEIEELSAIIVATPPEFIKKKTPPPFKKD